MKKAFLFFIICGCSSLVLTGCFQAFTCEDLQTLKLPLPTKDDIAIVNGRPLTLTDFILIRSSLRTPSNQQALWAGTATLAIQDESRSKGKELPLRTALEIVRYAIHEISAMEVSSSTALSLLEYYSNRSLVNLPLPEEVKKDLELIVSKSSIQKSPRALSLYY